MKAFRTTTFRIKFNSYQDAYFTAISKKYKFCLNLLSQWTYDYIQHTNEELLRKLDWEFRRFGYSKVMKYFPEKLFLHVFKQLPSAISQNIFPEALAIARARLQKDKMYHMNINSPYFTWTNVPKNKELKLPRSKHLKKEFKDSVQISIPENVFGNLESKKYYLRFRFKDGQWFCDIVKQIQINKTNKNRLFAGIDLNLNNIAYIDQVSKQPILFDLEEINRKVKQLLNHHDKLQSKGKTVLATRKLRKVRALYKSTLKIYAIRIVQFAKQNGITRIAVGDVSKSFKKKQLSRSLRRFWNLIPWSYFTNYLHSYAEKFGIWTYEISEAYTSKVSFLSNDPFNDSKVSGQRISRGLYKDGRIIIHADINAAANIMRKAAQNFDVNINISYKELSAVRRVYFKLLNWISLSVALIIVRAKDFLNNEGKLKEFVTQLKSRYSWSAFRNIMDFLFNPV